MTLRVGNKVTWTAGPNKGVHVKILAFTQGRARDEAGVHYGPAVDLAHVEDASGRRVYLPVEGMVRVPRKLSGMKTVYCSYCGRRLSPTRAAFYLDTEGSALCATCQKEIHGVD